jgi:predicted nucleic acid-binding protein
MVIFVDTNVFIRAIVAPNTPDYERFAQQARDLFRHAMDGQIELITSEAHVSEAAHVLTSKRYYALAVEQAAAFLSTIIREADIKLANRSIVLEALELWARRPSIGFYDAIAAVHGRAADTMLATFDYGLRRIPGVNVWSFSDSVD